MNILIVGLGVIGTTYGYLFKKSGNNVEHYIRPSSPKRNIDMLNIKMLDGRISKQGTNRKDTYYIKRMSKKHYDFIFVSIPSGGTNEVVTWLNNEGIEGTVVLCSGIWEDPSFIKKMMQGRSYILGFPVAGGNIVLSNQLLNTCVFDHFMIESPENAKISNYSDLKQVFDEANIKLECPYNMLEWIWLHMAINAAVGSVAGKYADKDNLENSAEFLMKSSYQLKEVVKVIRETSSIVAKRGVCLKNYTKELLPYYLPTWISVPMMKKMFSTNQLTRKIMTLHTDIHDLMYVNRRVYETGKKLNVKCPIFYEAYKSAEKKFL